jgi:hypothetical protein
VSRNTLMSGASASRDKLGKFSVYWGDANQGSNSWLNDRFGFSSNWPHLFYLLWKPKELGTNASWPQTEYEVEVDTQITSIFGHDTYFATNVADINGVTLEHLNRDDKFIFVDNPFASKVKRGMTLVNNSMGYSSKILKVEQVTGGAKVYISNYLAHIGSLGGFEILGSSSRGLNPAAILWQLFFEPPPFGLGMSTSEFELSDFEYIADYFCASGTEPTPMSLQLGAGKSFLEGISYVLEDIGAGWWYDTLRGKYRITVVRPNASEQPVLITTNEYSEADLELTFNFSVKAPANKVFSFTDANRRFTRSTIRISDDGRYKLCEDPSSTKVDLNTVRDAATANRVAQRRSQENEDLENVPLTLPFKFLGIQLNKLYQIEGLPHYYRVGSSSPNLKEFTNKVVFTKDVYTTNNDYVPIEQDIIENDLLGPYPDKLLRLIEPTRVTDPDGDSVFLLKVRDHSQIAYSELIMSPDDSSYVGESGPAGFCIGGVLEEAIDIGDRALIEEGPLVTVVGPDMLEVVDLTASEELWRAGTQLCIINNEVFFLRSITIVSATQFRLNGLLRARLGSIPQTHNVDDTLHITDSDMFTPTSPTYLAKGATLYAKTLPVANEVGMEADEIDPVSIVYQGGGNKPLAVHNIGTVNMKKCWMPGEDIYLRWSYRHYNSLTGAGILPAGETGMAVPPEGEFLVTISDGTDTKRQLVVTDPNYTYSNADLISDFGSEPSQIVVAVEVMLHGYSSIKMQNTIIKV